MEGGKNKNKVLVNLSLCLMKNAVSECGNKAWTVYRVSQLALFLLRSLLAKKIYNINNNNLLL